MFQSARLAREVRRRPPPSFGAAETARSGRRTGRGPRSKRPRTRRSTGNGWNGASRSGLLHHVAETAYGVNKLRLTRIDFDAQQSDKDFQRVLTHIRLETPHRLQNSLAS